MGNTQQVSDFVYFCSPLIPNEGKENALGYAQDLYDMFQLPALCLSIAITPLITFRTITLRLNHPDLLNTLGVTLSDLDTIVRGYKFPLETIQISEVLKGSKESQFDQVFEEFATTSHNFNTLLTQESIKQNLRATVNLQINYPSGDQVFDFLKRYSHDKSLMFAVGMEIAAVVYWNLVPEFSHLIKNDSWLNSFDPADLG
ncbi:hypothetical protein A2572_02600 [Candidatus Collierbacteria bacterium RIFOXYD1_FULL_40_9]|uniref:Uncharacterized protein n=1 Tax=Candidatus Collierbacteria bacterium RIFOXYD1_FULL_40_9 TaxID=1817731 RepID=A0A1F5FWB3_9BACT|nr:MAG: hypothetical protein A2572_02600 [Candidatus Collierbacteria bacterium RIFOXYD1_FULL_40_9]